MALVGSIQTLTATAGDWFVTNTLSAKIIRRSPNSLLTTLYVLDPSATSLHPQPVGSANPWPSASTSYRYIAQTGTPPLTVPTAGDSTATLAGLAFPWTAPTGDTGSATIGSSTATSVTFPLTPPAGQRPPIAGSTFSVAVPAIPPTPATVTIAANNITANQLAGQNFVSGSLNLPIVSNTATSGGNVVLTFTLTTDLTGLGTTYTIGLNNRADAQTVDKRVPPTAIPAASSGLPRGSIHGFAHNSYSYSADPVNGNILGATDALQQDAGPQKHLWLALTDLTNGDQTIFAAPFYNDKGEFRITNIPNGDYLLSYWDFDQLTIMEAQNITVSGDTEVATLRMPQWWTKIEGHVFTDVNGNGKQDPGEPRHPRPGRDAALA